MNLNLLRRELKEKAGFSGFVLVEGEKSSPLISVVFRKREAKKKKPSPSQVLKNVFPVSQIYSISSKPGFIIPASLQLLWSERQARACCPEDPEGWEMGAGSEAKLLPLVVQLG